MIQTLTSQSEAPARSPQSLHQIGVICGLAAGAWLGAAEAPTKLVVTGISPFVITLGMVMGVFVARWTLPMLLKGVGSVMLDLREKPHLMVWAALAGVLWSIANTLTVFAIRNVGLSIAFPLWNTNSLVGLFWGRVLFNELRGAGAKGWTKVLGGAVALMAGASILAYATANHSSDPSGKAMLGVMAALGAGMLWGTMYIPYRKAYISGMNPLSFVTIFTFGELGSTLILGAFFRGGIGNLIGELTAARPVLFWLFLGGFCWVIGDLFQQFAAKYIGIGRGIPLSNTNQLWGLAWGALVFGELTALTTLARLLVIAGSAVMIAGAAAIGMAAAPESELANWKQAMQRECDRYGLDPQRVAAALEGDDPAGRDAPKRQWWEAVAILAALGVFIWLALGTQRQPIMVDSKWMIALILATLACLGVGSLLLWRRTRFT